VTTVEGQQPPDEVAPGLWSIQVKIPHGMAYCYALDAGDGRDRYLVDGERCRTWRCGHGRSGHVMAVGEAHAHLRQLETRGRLERLGEQPERRRPVVASACDSA